MTTKYSLTYRLLELDDDVDDPNDEDYYPSEDDEDDNMSDTPDHANITDDDTNDCIIDLTSSLSTIKINKNI